MRFAFKTSYGQDIGLFEDRRQGLCYAVLLLVMLALPLVVPPYPLGEVTQVLIWALAGTGLLVLVGQAGQVSFGHGAFLAIGCYANLILQTRLGLPFLIALPLGGMAAGLAGLALALPAARLHGIYLAIATLAIAVLTEDVIVAAAPWTGGIGGMAAPDIALFGHVINRYDDAASFYWLTLAVALLALLAIANLRRSASGRAIAAIGNSEISARALGIDVARTKALAFAISATLTGLAGALLGHYLGFVNHDAFSLVVSIQLLTMIVIGGLGSLHGAFFGAMVIVILPQALAWARDLGAAATGSAAVTVPGLEAGLFGVILALFILFEPTGLYGRWIKLRTYFRLFPLYRAESFRRQRAYRTTERLR